MESVVKGCEGGVVFGRGPLVWRRNTMPKSKRNRVGAFGMVSMDEGGGVGRDEGRWLTDRNVETTDVQQ